MVMALTPYTLSQAEQDIGTLRGQIDILDEFIQMIDATFVPNPTGGAGLYSSSGFSKYASTDGSSYTNGVQTAHSSNNGQVVNSATPVDIGGMTLNVGAGNYVYESWLQITGDTSTYLGYLYMGGTATFSSFRGFVQTIGNGQPTTLKVQTTAGTNTNINFTVANAVQYLNVIRGNFTTTVAGTFKLSGATSGGDGFTVGNNGTLRVWPDV
jgi:hypothetical protein